MAKKAASDGDELQTARDTISRLNRRCQLAEAALNTKLDDFEKRGKPALRSHYWRAGYDAAVADQARKVKDQAHRCCGCGHNWTGDLHGGELCGDCWRKAQGVLQPTGDQAARQALLTAIANLSEEGFGYVVVACLNIHRQYGDNHGFTPQTLNGFASIAGEAQGYIEHHR